MSTTKNVKPATKDDFKKLQKELRELDLHWVDSVLKNIKSDPELEAEVKESFDRTKVYNVFGGVIRNGSIRLVVYRHSVCYRDKMKQAWQETK
jgi:hypothetical protein